VLGNDFGTIIRIFVQNHVYSRGKLPLKTAQRDVSCFTMQKSMLAKLRSLASDTVVYGISTILGRFLTFLLTPLYTNYVTKAELGDTAYLYSLIAFVNVIYSVGLDSAFFKYFQTPHNSTSAKTRIETTTDHNRSVFAHAQMGIAVVSAVLTLIFCVASLPLASALRLETSIAPMIVYAALIAFFDALVVVPFAALRMESRSKRFALLKFSVIVLNIVANLVLVVWLRMGIRGIFLAGLLSSFVSVLLLLPEVKRYVLGGKIVFDAALLRELLRFGLPTVPAAFSAMMLQVIDRPILKMFVDSASVGLYQANYRLGIPMMLAVTVFEYAWKPFYLRESSRKATRTERRALYAMLARVLTYFTVVCGVVFLVASLLMEFVVRMPFLGGRFVNPAYWSGLSIIPIVLGAYYFNGLYANFAASVYIRKRTAYLPGITGAAALANVVLNLVLIPRFGIWGAAYATLGAYMLSAGLMYLLTRRIYPIRYEWERIVLAVVLCLGVFVGAEYSTSGMSLGRSFLLRSAWILAYPLLLLGLGFFKAEEKALLRKTTRK